MIGEGNQAYVDSKIPEAVRIMQDVIRIEPRAASAWSVLAQCHADMNEHQKALQLRVMAAHLLHDSEEWDRLARHSRSVIHTNVAAPNDGRPTQRPRVHTTSTLLLWKGVQSRSYPRERHVGSRLLG
jgi:hypothetical protein